KDARTGCPVRGIVDRALTPSRSSHNQQHHKDLRVYFHPTNWIARRVSYCPPDALFGHSESIRPRACSATSLSARPVILRLSPSACQRPYHSELSIGCKPDCSDAWQTRNWYLAEVGKHDYGLRSVIADPDHPLLHTI